MRNINKLLRIIQCETHENRYAETQRQPVMESVQTQTESERPDLHHNSTLTIYRTDEHTMPNPSTEMIYSKQGSTNRITECRSLSLKSD
jgi:hypothetical protein